MTFTEAKHLHNGDEVLVKESGVPAIVHQVEAIGKDIWITVFYDGIQKFHHSEIQ